MRGAARSNWCSTIDNGAYSHPLKCHGRLDRATQQSMHRSLETQRRCLLAPRICGDDDSHCTFGSTSNWWNGGGDGSVHSSVVAPAPKGLSAARSFLMKASATP